MKIATIGIGNMARSLGGAWAEQGHEIYFGSREAARGQEAADQVGAGTRGGDNAEAAAFGEVIFYTPRSLPSEVLGDTSGLAGKVLIDCGNRPIPKDKVFSLPETRSYCQQIALDVPEVRVVKAFNTMAQEVFHHPPQTLRDSGQCVFVAGDDAEAKRVVSELSDQLGFEPLDCGPLAHAWLLESAGDLIRYLIFTRKGPFATYAVPTLPETEAKYGGRQWSTYS
ncbi:MAG: NAD(P)-binding domain-containing protein [Planctomycetota bacterium]